MQYVNVSFSLHQVTSLPWLGSCNDMLVISDKCLFWRVGSFIIRFLTEKTEITIRQALSSAPQLRNVRTWLLDHGFTL